MEELLLALLEGLLEIVVEIAIDSLADWLSHTEQKAGVAISYGGAIGLLLWGALAGGLASVQFPVKIFRGAAPLPGISLVVAPLMAGTAMHWIGVWRRRSGRKGTALATFGGGALFAFGMAAVRFLMVGLK